MTEQEQKAFFQDYVDKLKIQDEEIRKQLEIEENIANSGIVEIDQAGFVQATNTGNFYFYNIQTVGRGQQEFKRRYGNRPLVDNWIISGNSGVTRAQSVQNNSEIEVDDSVKYDLDFYISQIPTNQSVLDSLNRQRNDAYYNLGLIYKEQFKEYELAANNFENFLSNDPKENLILPAKYHLYKCYEFFNVTLSNKYIEEIVREYPDSRYSQIILNPKNVLESVNAEDSLENIYSNAYVCFEEGDYEYALQQLNSVADKLNGQTLEAKYQLLQAYIFYQTKGEEAFIEQLNAVQIDYPTTEEGKHAKSVLEEMQNKSVEK